jgi:hypothetical protein
MTACLAEPPAPPPAGTPLDPATTHPVMGLLEARVPLALLFDLANPQGLSRL